MGLLAVGLRGKDGILVYNLDTRERILVNKKELEEKIKHNMVNVINVEYRHNVLKCTYGDLKYLPDRDNMEYRVAIARVNNGIMVYDHRGENDYSVISVSEDELKSYKGFLYNCRVKRVKGESIFIMDRELVDEEYKLHNIKNVYNGELIDNSRLKPILYRQGNTNCVLDIKSRDSYTYTYSGNMGFSLSEIARDGKMSIYETVTLYGDLDRILDAKNQSHREEIAKLLTYESVRSKIDLYIADFNKRRTTRYNLDAKTGLRIPSKTVRYKDVEIDLSKLVNGNNNVNIEEYMYKLVITEIKLICKTKFNSGKVALLRKKSAKGLVYKVVDLRVNGGVHMTEEDLSSIYRNHEDFINVNIVNNKLAIKSMDGNVAYDIDKVLGNYVGVINNPTRRIKENIFAPGYREEINSNKELIVLESNSKNVLIPKEVETIGKYSIHINKNTESIVIGNNVQKISARAFKIIEQPKLSRIEINCNKKATVMALNALKDFCSMKAITEDTVVKINHKIDPEICCKIMSLPVRSSILFKNNKIDKTEEFTIDVYKYMLKGYVREIGKISKMSKEDISKLGSKLNTIKIDIKNLEYYVKNRGKLDEIMWGNKENIIKQIEIETEKIVNKIDTLL